MTARYADRVALISSEGRIAETGDPRQLMEDEGSRLWSLINKVAGPTQTFCWGLSAGTRGPLVGTGWCTCPRRQISLVGRGGAETGEMVVSATVLLRACCFVVVGVVGCLVRAGFPSVSSGGRGYGRSTTL